MEQKHSAENVGCQGRVGELGGVMGDAEAAVAAETVKVVHRQRSRVRRRDAASYTVSQSRTMRFRSRCQRNAIKSHELQPEMMKILYLHSTPTLHNIPCLNFVSPFQLSPLTFPLGCRLTGPFWRGMCLVHHGFLSRLHCSVSSHGLRVEFRGRQEDLAVQARVKPVLGDDALHEMAVLFWKLWVKLIDSLVDFWSPFFY